MVDDSGDLGVADGSVGSLHRDREIMTFSQVPGSPSFRSSATNAVAVIPLLSNDKDGNVASTHSARSFRDLFRAFDRYCQHIQKISPSTMDEKELLLIVPNASLTRPGDWRYDNTPFKFFHWGHGCQRLLVFDGRPEFSRVAHDRVINHALTRDWIDFTPSRRTAAVIGVLNLRDCVKADGEADQSILHRAEEELQNWSQRYSTPSYEVHAHGRGNERDNVVERLFVFDSFDEDCQGVDLSKTKFNTNILAFPPSDEAHSQMMDLHLNVVVNDLAVAIFQQIEKRIRDSDELKGTGDPNSYQRKNNRISRFLSSDPRGNEEPMSSTTNLSLSNITSVLNPDSGSANSSSSKGVFSQLGESVTKATSTSTRDPNKTVQQLLTPVDEVWDYSNLSSKDAETMKKREVGRREKFAADLCLLAGSPMDAYERYLKAAEMCKSKNPDPLWYAGAMEGCAAAHIAMAEAGGYNVDEYLENNFQLPDEIMALAVATIQDARKPSSNKQTLPKIVFTLCEEALNVLARHPTVSCFHAELLLKLVWYCSAGEECHMMCRWGEGDGCYGGDQSGPRRSEKHSVHKMAFGNMKTKEGENIIVSNTQQRLRKWCELMHRAVSTGALDSSSRVDVGSRCARLCIRGMEPTSWKGSRAPRIQLPRKAAFFSAVAAESISSGSGRFDQRARELWLLASNLYSNKGNKNEQGGSYGWATLRASILHGLSLHGRNLLSSEATEQLLKLLSEISPDNIEDADDVPIAGDRLADDGLAGTMDASQRSESGVLGDNISRFSQMKKAGFFSQISNNSSILNSGQSKWLGDDVIRPIQVPLVEASEISQLVLSLSCVWPNVNFEKCSLAQKLVIGHTFSLRKVLPALSFEESTFFSEMGKDNVPPPLFVSSATVEESEASKSLERIAGRKKSGAMSTFFNPYAQKKGGGKAMLVAEGEERFMSIAFGNLLAVPLEVPSCQMEFEHDEKWRILATSMSFVVPAKAKNFAVKFPFTAISRERAMENEGDRLDDSGGMDMFDKKEQNIFVMKGLNMTCLGRSSFVPIHENIDVAQSLLKMKSLPDPASAYPRLPKKKPKPDDEQVKLQFEVVPSQPRLVVSCASTGSFVEDENTISIYLSDGEVFMTEPFFLENHVSTNGSNYGMMERLQIIAIGLTGHREEMLFDTEPQEPKKEEKNRVRKPPESELKMKALCDELSLDGVNDAIQRREKGNKVTFQILAAHEFASQLAGGRNVRIRFRYRGKSPSEGTEIWRKREILLKIVRVKGPRISSLTFRPDLSWGCAYSELCVDLAQQNLGEAITPYERTEPKEDFDETSYVLERVGMDPGVHVCSRDVVVLISVANETNSTIVLSNRNGLVGGFEGSPMETITVSSGVSVRIPVVLPRIRRMDESGEPADVVAQLVAKTELQWKEVSSEFHEDTTGISSMESSGKKRVRQGRMRIPPNCLKEIVAEHPSFASRICEPPCDIILSLGGGQSESKAPACVQQGTPIDVFVEVLISNWVPEDVVEECSLTLEFCCARKEDGSSHSISSSMQQDYIWCGQIRKMMRACDEEKNHRARILILQPGHFVLSACAKIANDAENGAEEVWWAPVAENVVVQPASPDK